MRFNYNNSKIYKIIDIHSNRILYTGYTTSNLRCVLQYIKGDITNKKYRNIGAVGIYDIDIVLIKNVNVENKEQLKKEYYDTLDSIEKNFIKLASNNNF